jgi:hypothetical protein
MSTQGFGQPEMPPSGSAWPAEGNTTSDGDGQTTTKDAAKEQARGVAQEGVEGGKHVASVATGQAKEVASEAVQQAKGLVGQARSEVMEQVNNQQQRLADQLHSFSQQLGSMASSSQQEGMAKDLAQQASRQIGKAAHWLSERDPGALGSELKGFAQNKPGTFLAMSAGIGMIAGRMTRGAKAGPPQSDDSSTGYPENGQTSELRRRLGAPHAQTPDYPQGTIPGGVGTYSEDPMAGDPMTRRDPRSNDPLANDPLANDPLAPRTTGLTP